MMTSLTMTTTPQTPLPPEDPQQSQSHGLPKTTLAIATGTEDMGSADQQAQLLRDSQDVWFRFCVANLHDVDLATEAVQETAMRVLENPRAFEGRSTFRTWSLGIALNVCREIRRRHLRYAKDAKEACPQTPVKEPHQQACHTEQVQKIHALLKTLPGRQQEVVTLRYFEGLSIEQASEVMQCAKGTVKATLFQAIANLRKRWERSS